MNILRKRCYQNSQDLFADSLLRQFALYDFAYLAAIGAKSGRLDA